MNRLVIGFGYKRRRGKDTAAKMAVEYLNRVSRAAVHDYFAWPLKEGIGRMLLGLNEAQLYGAQKEEVDPIWGETPRKLMQLIGTDVLRKHYRDDVLALSLERRALSRPDLHVIISDVRVDADVVAVRRLGGHVVRCDRAVAVHPSDFHSTEDGLDDYSGWDAVLDNTGSLDHLKAQVECLCDDLLDRLPK